LGPNKNCDRQPLTVKELATALNISTNWIYKQTAPGCPDPLPCLAIGRGKRFDLEKLLRKWGSTHLIADRLPVNAVQERLGHSRPDIVLIHYARLLDESAVAAAVTVRCGAGKCW
jgi:hypothetical protein